MEGKVPLRAGVMVPQGWTGEYTGWDAATAWNRSIEIARTVERLGFESIWAFDHFHTRPEPTDEMTLEGFVFLAALARETRRVRLGHLVLCAGYRNPALVAKMISTLDVVSGGRAELGIGAGWKRDEWVAYGYGFPSTRERLEALRDALGVITAMLGPGRAHFSGKYAEVADAINEPRGLQEPRIPVIVGGNGPERTWRIAARYADELNLDGMLPPAVERALPVIRSRCEEIDRDPASLRVSNHIWWDHSRQSGEPRIELLGRYRDLGISRVQTLLPESAETDDPIYQFAEDCQKAGVEI